MNPDLALFNQDLKNTGTGNLFMVFREPDIAVEKQPDGQLVVEIKGLDIYDPTTGQIRNSSTDHPACWFIDTNYNEESFFVRHACFTRPSDPYGKLKRALKAEINEEAGQLQNRAQADSIVSTTLIFVSGWPRNTGVPA